MTPYLKRRAEKESELSPSRVQELFDYDPITGTLRWRNRPEGPKKWNTKFSGKVAGYPNGGCIYIRINSVGFKGHRLVWAHYYGEWPKNYVDHIDGNALNNAISNLRHVDFKQSAWNTRTRSNNILGLKNIHQHAYGGYMVRFYRWRTPLFREYFGDLETAIAVRNLIAPTIYGEYNRREAQ